ncbi:MAG: hypothetical protein PHF29_10025, partial [Candidatus Riflebacteria bacterium]|nr:hypothetical protein [Candidatus Riflebacteria bacterium]
MTNKSMTHDEIKRLCVKWRVSGIQPAEIAEKLKEIGVVGYDRLRVKSITRPDRCVRVLAESDDKPIEEKEGETERKPKYERTEKGYTVYYGQNQKVSATVEEIEKAFKLFCIGGMTLNQTALTMGWTRAELYAIKTAFLITKDSIPLLPETIDSMNADEIAETIRIEKKRTALNKFHSAKYQDIEKDNKTFHQLNYYFNLALEKIQTIDPKPFDVQRKIEEKAEKHLLVIADIHAGAISNNRLNTYNFEVMRARFEQVAEKIINLLPPCELVIADGGDRIMGLLHGSILRNNEGCVDSVFEVTECYTKLFLTLIKHGFTIEFHSISGNHDSIFPVKTDRSDDSSFSRIVDWALQLQFKHFKQVKFVEAIDNMALIKLFDYGVLLLHGDKSKKLGRYQRLFKERIIEIIGAHYHSYSATEDDNIPVYRVNSFCGNDEYATGLGLHSEPGVRLITYGKRGRICDRLL